MTNDKKKFPGVPGLNAVAPDAPVYIPPPGTDTAGAIERIAIEAKQLEELKVKNKARGQILEPPLTETNVSELTYSHKLVALLLHSGASTLDIASELGATAQEIERFINNRLIIQQMELYKERFSQTDANSKLKEMLDPGLKMLREVILGTTQLDEAKRVDTIKWLIEKLTGKPAQQIDVHNTVNFGNLLDEMKKMRETRGPLTSDNNSQQVIDVTPTQQLEQSRKAGYEKWLTDFKARKERNL